MDEVRGGAVALLNELHSTENPYRVQQIHSSYHRGFSGIDRATYSSGVA